jgi:hypothetical protein
MQPSGNRRAGAPSVVDQSRTRAYLWGQRPCTLAGTRHAAHRNEVDPRQSRASTSRTNTAPAKQVVTGHWKWHTGRPATLSDWSDWNGQHRTQPAQLKAATQWDPRGRVPSGPGHGAEGKAVHRGTGSGRCICRTVPARFGRAFGVAMGKARCTKSPAKSPTKSLGMLVLFQSFVVPFIPHCKAKKRCFASFYPSPGRMRGPGR